MKKMAKKQVKESTYAARAGSRFSDKDAAVIGPELERIARGGPGGKATAHAVLKEARAPKSPLHSFFEWDNTKAAEQHRLSQARIMLASIEITWVDQSSKKPMAARAFHVVRGGSTSSPGYVPLAVIQSDDAMMQEVIGRAKREAASWAQRYQRLRSVTELTPVFKAIDDILPTAEDRPIAAE